MPTFNYVTHSNLEYFKDKVNSSYLKTKGDGNKPAISNVEYKAYIWRTTEDTWNASYDANPSSHNNGQLFRLYSQGTNDKQITDILITDGANDGVWVRSNWNAQNNSKSTNFTGWKRIPLATEIPINLSELGSDSTHRVVTDSQILAWNNKSDFSGSYNDLTNKPTIPTLTSQLTNDSGFIDSNGGTISGIISRNSGGSWISARDNVIVKQTKSNEAHNGYNPIVGVKTQLGFWSLGSEGGESLCLSYDTDIDYNNQTNNNVALFFPLSAGTLATQEWVGNQGYITGITSSDITNALGYTPYNATNPDGYITSSYVKDGTLTLSKTQGAQSPSSTFSANQSSNTSFNVDDLTARYNLSKWDSVNDAQTQLTRQSWEIDLSKLSWAISNMGGTGIYGFMASVPSYLSMMYWADVDNVAPISSNYYTPINYGVVMYQTKGIAIYDNVIYIKDSDYGTTSSNIDLASFKTSLITKNIKMQYKLSSAYNETITPNQPLLNLDSSGCNFVRNQWEKSLNLWSGTYRKDNNWHVYLTNLNLKPNTTYFIKSPDYLDPYITVFAVYGASGSKEYWRDVYSYKLGNGWAFTTPGDLGNITQIYMQFSSQYAFSSSDLIMLNEGNHPYPYQPYDNDYHFLEDEYKKTSNLFNVPYVNTSSVAQYYTQNINKAMPLQIGQTYTLSFLDGYSSGEYFVYVVTSDTYYNIKEFSQYFTQNGPEWSNVSNLGTYQGIYRSWRHSLNTSNVVTFTAQYKYLYILWCKRISGTQVCTNIMLNKGASAKPYLIPNGDISHQGTLIYDYNDNSLDELTSESLTYSIYNFKTIKVYVELHIGNTNTKWLSQCFTFMVDSTRTTQTFLVSFIDGTNGTRQRQITISNSGTTMEVSKQEINGVVSSDTTHLIVRKIYGCDSY